MQKMVPLSLSLSRDDTLEGQMVLQSVMVIIHPNLNKEMVKETYNQAGRHILQKYIKNQNHSTIRVLLIPHIYEISFPIGPKYKS